jgi:hypothetical protein
LLRGKLRDHDYITLNHKSDPEFGTQQGILDDWNLYNIKVDTWRLERLSGIRIPFIIGPIQFNQVMADTRDFDYNVLQRDYNAWLSDQSYRAELDAQWSLVQADYEVWKSQISR